MVLKSGPFRGGILKYENIEYKSRVISLRILALFINNTSHLQYCPQNGAEKRPRLIATK